MNDELERLWELVHEIGVDRDPRSWAECRANIAKALSIINNIAERERWVPPRDRLPEPGCPVLIYGLNELGKPRVLRAQYAGENTLELGGEWFDGCTTDEDGAEYCPPGWYETNEHEDTHWRIYFPVLGWRALPAAPSGCGGT